MNGEAPEREQEKTQAITANVLLLLGVVVVVLVLLTQGDSLAGSWFATPTPDAPEGWQAAYACQQFVSDRLKAPASAQFQDFMDASFSQIGKARFTVASYVDAENSFGAMLRTHYVCAVEYRSSDGWHLQSLDLGE